MKQFIVYLSLLFFILSCSKEMQKLDSTSPQQPEFTSENQNLVSIVDDSIKFYLTDAYEFIFNDSKNISQDTFNNYSALLGNPNADSIFILNNFMLYNCTNLTSLSSEYSKLKLYIEGNYLNLTQLQKEELIYNAFDALIEEQNALENRENCRDYKLCLENAKNQAALAAAYGYTLSAAAAATGPWSSFIGFVATSAYVTLSYNSAKGACCTQEARQNSCCQ